jgi:hypothetical protein
VLKKIVTTKTFRFIAGDLAAEQRTTVAHSASYGFGRPQISPAPAGATETCRSKINFFRTIRGLNCFGDNFPTAGAVGYYLPLLRS